MNILMSAPRPERRGRSDRMAPTPRGESRGFQIGPRIRVGGTLGKIGQNAKIGLGKLEKSVAPLAMFVPGVGPALAAGLEASGNIMDTSNGGLHLNNLPGVALKTAGMYAGGKVAQGLEGKLAGTSLGKSLLGKVGLGTKVPIGDAGYGGVTMIPGPGGSSFPMPSSVPGVTGGSSWWDKAKSVFSGGGSDGKGAFGSVGDFLGGGNPSGLDKVLLGAGIVDQALQRRKQQDLLNKGLQYETDAYDAKAPLRSSGLTALENGLTNSPNPYLQRYLSTKTPVGG